MTPEAKLKKATRRYEEARQQRDSAIREAATQGMTSRAIAAVVGLSFQRVHQIVRADDPR